MNVSRYRPDIDGLRAFAVFSVILFHIDANNKYIGGGFIGVDIFFVISGFLITKLIKEEVVRTNNFNFSNFYIRRIRRLLPALIVTIFLTLAFSIILFSPAHLERLGGSILYALTSISNFYFWIEADYFDTAADIKPLLHTWSLSIEEQFYLFWPLVFVVALKKGHKFAPILVLIFILILSLFLNYIFLDGQIEIINKLSKTVSEWISDGKSTLFYLLPFRAYEFAIGGLMVFIKSEQPNNRVFHEIVLLAAFCIISYSVFMFSSEDYWPSYNALVPCLGTAMIIYSGQHAQFLGKILSNKVSVNIGLISYSLYLVHWPIIVFWQYWKFNNISTTKEIIFIILISLVVATLMYKFIEQPFRTKPNEKTNNLINKGTLGITTCVIIIVIVSSNILKNNGWEWRTEKVNVAELLPPDIPKIPLTQLEDETQWTFAYRISENLQNKVKVLVIGDSHAHQLSAGAKYLSSRYKISFDFYLFVGCPPVFGTYKIYGAPKAVENETPRQINCRQQVKKWEEYIRQTQYDYVILASRWNWLFEPKEFFDTKQRRDLLVDIINPKFSVKDSKLVFQSALDRTVKSIKETGAKAIIFGQVPHAGINLEGCNNVPTLVFPNQNERCNHVPKKFVMKRSLFSNNVITKTALVNDSFAVLPTDYFCFDDTEFCKTIHNGIRLKDDDDHINEYGSVYLVKEWEKTDNFPFKDFLLTLPSK